MYIKTIEFIHSLLREKLNELNEQYNEVFECLDAYRKAPAEVRGDAHNDKAYAELSNKFSKIEAERDLTIQVVSDFERTNWH